MTGKKKRIAPGKNRTQAADVKGPHDTLRHIDTYIYLAYS